MTISSDAYTMPAPETPGMVIFGAGALNPKYFGCGKLACSEHFVEFPLQLRSDAPSPCGRGDIFAICHYKVNTCDAEVGWMWNIHPN